MPRALLSILAGLFVASSAAAQVAGPSPAAQRYDGYRLVEVTAEDARQVLALASFDATGGPLVFAGEQVAAGIPLQFAADAAGLEILASLGLEPEVVFEDLGAAIQLERDRSVDALRASSDTFFDAYRTFDEIRARLAEIDASSGLVSIEQIGESFEGRPIELVRVSGAGDALTKPTIFMTFGCHAREWISASSAPFLVDALASRYGQDARVTRLLDLATVAIVPQANPDGYEFTWTDDRFWRKTRRPLEDGVNVGVDWNRNFSERWLTGLISGPSEGLYAGPEPFSEP
ncbi:MAG: M14 family zinc carboxypeptidase, partial [Planctomycetota bacterium]